MNADTKGMDLDGKTASRMLFLISDGEYPWPVLERYMYGYFRVDESGRLPVIEKYSHLWFAKWQMLRSLKLLDELVEFVDIEIRCVESGDQSGSTVELKRERSQLVRLAKLIPAALSIPKVYLRVNGADFDSREMRAVCRSRRTVYSKAQLKAHDHLLVCHSKLHAQCGTAKYTNAQISKHTKGLSYPLYNDTGNLHRDDWTVDLTSAKLPQAAESLRGHFQRILVVCSPLGVIEAAAHNLLRLLSPKGQIIILPTRKIDFGAFADWEPCKKETLMGATVISKLHSRKRKGQAMRSSSKRYKT